LLWDRAGCLSLGSDDFFCWPFGSGITSVYLSCYCGVCEDILMCFGVFVCVVVCFLLCLFPYIGFLSGVVGWFFDFHVVLV